MAVAVSDLRQDFSEARQRTLDLIADLTDDQMERQIDPIMSPLVWDLGHIAAYEDLWLNHRYGGLELLHEELAAIYDAFETPRTVRGDIEILDRRQALAYLGEVRERSSDVLDRMGPDPVLHELVLRHELQHTETMRQAMVLGGLLEPRLPALGGDEDWIDIEPGTFELGAGPSAFSYDNERPRHSVQLEAFSIARTPITNATFLSFCEGGGYERREWWSAEAWAWKEEYDIGGCHRSVAARLPHAPASHVSFYEAQALARFIGAELPTEAQWERAADRLDGVGLVWEWTSSQFRGYPGFSAHPYREYSEVFFDSGYRVLRGGSWATHPRVASKTFRNWDHPQRRQIFAGFRPVRSAKET